MRVEELATILESFKDEVLASIKGIDAKIKGLFDLNKEIEGRLKAVEAKISHLEDYSRRENLLFFGIADEKDETAEACESKVMEIVRDKLGIHKEIEFQRVHRLGRHRRATRGVNARPIIVRFLRAKDRDLVLRNAFKLKDQGVSLSEDFCQQTRDKRKMLLPHLKNAKKSGKKAFLRGDSLIIEGSSYSVDGNIVRNSRSGAVLDLGN